MSPPDSSGELDRWAHAVLVAATGGTTAPPAWLARRIERGLGGVCLFARNIAGPAEVRALTEGLRAVRGDVLVCTDEEGGDVTRLHHRTGSPHLGALALAATGDPAVTRATAGAIGRELAEAGVDWDLAPVADVPATAQSPVIGVRAFGADPVDAARHVAAYVAGLADAGVVGCAKHFPGHGATDADSHTDLPRVTDDRVRLEQVDLVPFRAAIEAGVETVMLGHLVVESVDADLPASLSPAAVRLLRQDLGFTGLVVTDAVDMDAVARTWTTPGAAALAIAAGADAVCISGGRHDEEIVEACRAAIVDAVRAGSLPEQRLAEAAARVQVLASRPRRALPAPAGLDQGDPCDDDPYDDDTAARSLRVRGRPQLPPGPLDVVVRSGAVNIAAGVVPWHPGPLLVAARPGTRVHEGRSVLRAPLDRGRPLVVVVRDLHRHPDLAREVNALVAERPDAVVVETGVPVLDPGGRAWVCTSGASAASAAAVARLLVGGPVRERR